MYATRLSDRARLDPYVNMQGSVPLGVLAVLSISLSAIACVVRRQIADISIVCWCALASGTLVYIVNAVCVYYIERYALPLFVTIVIALYASLRALLPCTGGCA